MSWMETAIGTAEAIRRGERSARETAEEALRRIAARNPALNAFVVVDAELALREAERVDARLARGEDPGPLAGVPFGVKDMDHCAGLPTSYGSLLHKGKPPLAEDSVHVGRMRSAGAVPVGVTSSSEFGTVHFVRTRAWGVTRNPWDPAKTSGGSSGGSAAAVAAGMVPLATAGDGGGSTRIPAAFSGLVGLKPSYGRIPREGAVTSQTAVWGALTTTVADAARHLDVTAGPDDRDRTSLPPPGVVYERAIEERPVAGLRAAWSPDLGYAAVDPEVASLAERAAVALVEAAGCAASTARSRSPSRCAPGSAPAPSTSGSTSSRATGRRAATRSAPSCAAATRPPSPSRRRATRACCGAARASSTRWRSCSATSTCC